MIYVISDIHGNLSRFNSIMQQIHLKAEDTLYVLGDVIDRYPDGIKILQTLMGMTNAKILLGNHEHMMLNAFDHMAKSGSPYSRELRLWYQNGGKVTHEYLKHIPKSVRKEIFEYIRSWPLNYDINVNGRSFKLVHGSPVEMIPDHVWGYESLEEYAVWHRISCDDPEIEGVTIIFGHTPTLEYQSNNPLEIWKSDTGGKIGIDCGSGFPEPAKQGKHPFYGRLACIRLDDMTVFYSIEDNIISYNIYS